VKKDMRARLAERTEANKRGSPCSPEKDRLLLVEYLDETNPTSYRKMAAKHELGVNTVMRAIRRAAEAASGA
jgi:hypothetical protein